VSDAEKKDRSTKRIPVGAIKLQFAGELILPRSPGVEFGGLFRRYESLFEALANMERTERLVAYRMLNGLMLTSYAKKAKEVEEKKKLFDLKNSVFLSLVNAPAIRRKLTLKYLASKNFRVLKFCDECTKKNTEAKLEQRQWKFCKKCQVDKNFYNVLSINLPFKDGQLSLFLSNDLIPKVQALIVPKLPKSKLEDAEEQAQYLKFQYNVRNLDAFALDSVMEMHKKVMAAKLG